ncbi:MAG: tRNA (guanosine(37)-N1)-methyltransferase TrmD [Candidatus Paceibacterota bacterium]|jgi:tRNA (guanine37-N1)-methyltransferase
MNFHIITLFPESFESYLNVSIVKRAQKEGYIGIEYYNPRDFVLPRRSSLIRAEAGKPSKKSKKMTYAERRIDDRPYGGGPGMVIEALPIARAIEETINKIKNKNKKIKIVFFSPSGKQFTNKVADTLKKYTDIILICGRYEGIDARIKKMFKMTDISVGPYTLTGGELPGMIVIDSIARRIDGVLGDKLSIEEERIASPDVYTRPEVIEFGKKKYRVPKVLLSGHHSKINDWKVNRKGK